MKLKNYTTGIPWNKSISEIEEMLQQTGASHIMKEYLKDGRVLSLTFKINGMGYMLPANSAKVKTVLLKNRKRASPKLMEEQAERVAWRVLKDWIHAQLSLIQIGQAELEQVMLPYAFDGRRTFYDVVKEKGLGNMLAIETEAKL